MATLRDTMIHGKLGVLDDISMTDNNYNVAKVSDEEMTYGQSDYTSTILGQTINAKATTVLTLEGGSYVRTVSPFAVAQYGTGSPPTGVVNGQIYFKLIS